MENEQKKELGTFTKYKAMLIKLGIIAIILIAVVLEVFSKGYSNAEEK